MSQSVFIHLEFLFLILVSIFLPVGIYGYLMRTRAISRSRVLLLGVLMIVIAGVDVYLLQRITTLAQLSASTIDDFFVSEISVALYLLPALFAGIGTNMISHILISHLGDAERRFDREHR